MSRLIRLSALATLATFALAAPTATAQVLCAKDKNGKPKGKVVVRSNACKADKEIQLDLVDFGLDELLSLVAARQNFAIETASIDGFAETAFTSVVGLGTSTPSDGFLMVWGNVNAEYDISSDADTNADLDCQLSVDGTQTGTVVDQEFADVAAGSNSGESIALSGVAPVATGDHTVDVECRKSGNAVLFVKQRSVMTLFVTLEGEIPVLAPEAVPAARAASAAAETNE